MVTWPKKAPVNGSLLVRPDISCVLAAPFNWKRKESRYVQSLLQVKVPQLAVWN